MKLTPSRFRPLITLVGFWVVSVVVILTLMELISWAILAGYGWLHPDYYEKALQCPAYAQAAWVPEYLREQRLWEESNSGQKYVPFRLWGNTEWHGKYINADPSDVGVWRRTLNPTAADCKIRNQTVVWMFGGSTVFGTGVPDWATLPSYLSHSLNRSGHGCLLVRNLGVEAYVSTQELILLMEKLKEGSRPDVVIFYDGVNDAWAWTRAPDPRLAHFWTDLIRARVDGTIRGRFDFIYKTHLVSLVHLLRARFRRRVAPVTHSPAQAAIVVDNYEANLQLARMLSQARRVTFYSFLQPSLEYGHKPLVPYEQELLSEWPRSDSEPFRLVYEEAQRRSAQAGSVDLTGLFDSVSEPIYVDGLHLGPRGNEIVADAIAKYIEEHPGGGPSPTDKEHQGNKAGERE